MKKYRITHNPYFMTTTVEEFFEGGSTQWDTIGGEKAPELNRLISKKEPIQNIGYKLLEYLEKERSGKMGEYEIEYIGLRQDYDDLQIIYNKFKQDEKYKNSKLTGIKHLKEYQYDEPIELQNEFAKKVDSIIDIYKKEPEFVSMLKKCKDKDFEKYNVLVVGMQNSGKSTLINALLGKKLLSVSGDVETALVYSIEKSDTDYIEIVSSDSEIAKVNFNGEVVYDSNVKWLRDVIDGILEQEIFLKASTCTEKMALVLKAINDYHKKEQIRGTAKPLKEIRIGLSDFSLLDSKFNYRIKDFPGKGAQFLEKEHKAAINEAIKREKNAVIIYVLSADAVAFENVQDFLNELEKIDADRKEGLSNQIDFERSIYVLNKADGLSTDVLNKETLEKYRAFEGKKLTLVSAEAALQLRTTGEMEGKHHVRFVQPIKESETLLDLYDKAILPIPVKEAIYRRKYFSVEGSVDRTPLERTAVPLIVDLLDDYAGNSASIHKVRSYYSRLEEMFRNLEEEEKKRSKDLKDKKENLYQEETNTKALLKTACEGKYDSYTASFDKEKDSLKKKLKESLESSYRMISEKADACFNEKVKTKNLRDMIEKRIQNELSSNWQLINESAKNEKIARCEKFSKQLLEALKSSKEEIPKDDFDELEKIIKGFKGKDSWSDFELDTKFSFASDGGKDIFKYIFRKKDWIHEKTKNCLLNYWDKEVITPLSDTLITQVNCDNKELKNEVISKIEKISPLLTTIRTKINSTEDELNEFHGKMKKTDEIKNECKTMIERGTVHV